MTINKNTVIENRDKINEYLKALGDLLDMDFHAGNCSYDGDKATYKLEMRARRTDGKSTQEVEFEKNKLRHFGLFNVEFGDTFKDRRGETFSVAGCAARRNKYSLYGKSNNGKTYKFAIEDVTFDRVGSDAYMDADLAQ